MKTFTECEKNKFLKQMGTYVELSEKRKQFAEACKTLNTAERRSAVTDLFAHTDWVEYMMHIKLKYGVSGLEIITATAMNPNLSKDTVLSLVELERKMFLENESKTRFMIHMILTTFSAAVAFAAFGWQFIPWSAAS